MRSKLIPPLLGYHVMAGGAAVVPATPDSIDGLALWLDYSDATTLFTDAGTTPVSADNDAIYQANDKSGLNNHSVQSTEAARPLYKTNIKNSKSIARFDSVDDTMIVTDHASLQFGTGGLTAFIVWTSSNIARGDTSQNTFLSKNYTGFEMMNYQSNCDSYLGGSSNPLNGVAAVANSTYYILAYRRVGTTYKSYINGVEDGTATNAANVSRAGTNLYVGWRPSGSADAYFLGDISEILLYNNGISDLALAGVTLYLNNKWDVY